MSTGKEIREVYLSDIARATKTVRHKSGVLPFMDGLIGCRVFEMWAGLGLDQIIVNDEQDTKIAEGCAPETGREEASYMRVEA